MSTPGLFVPTYGQPAKVHALGKPKINNRAIPSKSAASRPIVSKRSLMPSLVFNGKIEYVQSFEAAESAARAILAARPEVLGFDIEWQVSFVAGEAPRPTATLQLCVPDRPACPETSTSSARRGQHASQPSSSPSTPSVWGTAFVFHLSSMCGHPSAVRGLGAKPPSPPPSSSTGDSAAKGEDVANSNGNNSSSNNKSMQDDEENLGQNHHNHSHSRSRSHSHSHNHNHIQAPSHPATAAYLPESLALLLSDPGILLAGVGVGGDVNRLEGEYEQLRASGIGGVVDLSEVAKRKVVPDRRRRGMWSLADLCGELLQLELRKPNSLRTGSWERRPLSVDQLFYAAADAYAGLRLWQVMQGMPDLVLQRAEANTPRRDTTAVVAAPSPSNTAAVTGDAAGSGGKGTTVEAKIEGKGCEQPALGPKPTSSDGVGSANTAPVTSRARPRLPQSKLETHRLWHEDGLSVDAVAGVRCNKASTVRGYLSDCIEAGLPYDWSRVGIDSDKEETILRALLAATGNQPPAATGRDPTTAPATCPSNKDEAAADGSFGAPGADGTSSAGPSGSGAKPLAASGAPVDGLRAANVLCAPTPAAAGALGGSCGGAAASAVRTAEGLRGEDGGGDGSRPANVAVRGVPRTAGVKSEGGLTAKNDGHAHGESSSHGGASSNSDGNSNGAGSASRGAPTGGDGGAEGTRREGEIGRWDSVRLKEVKELAPGAEYWEIRMVLARLKAGWCGYSP